MYGRIERFEGTDANRLDASDDEQRRRVVGRYRGEAPEGKPYGAAGAPRGHADLDEVPVDEWLRPPPP